LILNFHQKLVTEAGLVNVKKLNGNSSFSTFVVARKTKATAAFGRR
jgi:hypothetical protein